MDLWGLNIHPKNILKLFFEDHGRNDQMKWILAAPSRWANRTSQCQDRWVQVSEDEGMSVWAPQTVLASKHVDFCVIKYFYFLSLPLSCCHDSPTISRRIYLYKSSYGDFNLSFTGKCGWAEGWIKEIKDSMDSTYGLDASIGCTARSAITSLIISRWTDLWRALRSVL